MPDRQFIVAVDFDLTLAKYDGWKGDFTPPLPPIEGMPELINRLHQSGCLIVIWTCRQNHEQIIKDYCKQYGIHIDGINENVHPSYAPLPKIFADVYLDDRGLHFQGKTDGVFEEIMSRRKHWLETHDHD